MERLQHPFGQSEHGLNSGGADIRLKQRHRMRDDWHRAGFHLGMRIAGTAEYGQKIDSRKMLGSENSIHCFKRKLATAVQEVGNMRLPKAGLTSQQRDTDRSPLYPAEQLQA